MTVNNNKKTTNKKKSSSSLGGIPRSRLKSAITPVKTTQRPLTSTGIPGRKLTGKKKK